MADDVLRMRATVSSEEALANIRAIGREFGLLPQKAKPQIDQLNWSFKNLGATIGTVGRELRGVVPGLAGFGLGAAGVGIAVGSLIRTLNSVSEGIVQLKYRSRELGVAENALRGFSVAAQKAGIAPEAFDRALGTFKRNTEDFALRIGNVREEMIRMGAGPVVTRINAAATTVDKLKVAFDFKTTLDKLDPSGERGRRFFEDIGLGAETARLSWEELQSSVRKPMSPEAIASAKKYNDALIDLGEAFTELKQTFGTAIFPSLAGDLKSITDAIELIKQGYEWWKEMNKPVAGSTGRTPLLVIPGVGSIGDPRSGFRELEQQVPKDRIPALPPGGGTFGGGFSPVAFREGFGDGSGADLSEGSRMVKDGVFAALVDFQGYVSGGGAPAGGGMAGGGAPQVSFGGISGGWSGGGGAGTAPAGPAAAPPMGGAGPSVSDLAKAGAGGTARPMESRGGSAGITAPAGTPIQRGGMTTVTTSGGRKFQVDSRFAANFQGFINDYEKAGGVIGPESGTLGHRPHNPSGHPIGAAIDINQVGYGVRGKGGATLPVGTENALAEKWGLVSGANWRRPDTGHFGIKNVEAARQALMRNGVDPDTATAIATQGQGSDGGKTVKGSVFGSTHGFRDPSEPRGRKTASGVSNEVPGIALPDRSTLGQMFEVTTPDGRKIMLPQTDVGPAARTGRGIDITSSAAAQMGYTSKTFPTDQPFSYRRIDAANSPNLTANGTVNVNVTAPPGTKTDARSDGMFSETKITNYKQMQPTENPSVLARPGG